MKSTYLIAFLAGLIGLFGWTSGPPEDDLKEVEKLPVQKVLILLGDDKPDHYIDKIDHVKAETGKQLVNEGWAPEELGGSGQRISRHFVCTDCHTTGREHYDIAKDDPVDRLKYCMDNGLPLKPGSTFWGITNRSKWYSNDYVKKYGDLAKDAQDTLKNAVQLCAKECSSGRYLTDSELECVMHYLQSLELTIDDLGLTEELHEQLYLAVNDEVSPNEKRRLIDLIKTKYNHECFATFADPIPVDKRAYGKNGDPVKGKFIYENSCMSCHAPNRVTQFEIINDEVNKKFFARKMRGQGEFSIYDIIRKGTHPVVGRRQYMPFYTIEKLTDEQIEHLAAFINQTK